mmetsp:Transcript_11410/g.33632  ORF Transcript_11410/g.33632 Transcript_11410/m.33632 type:complete len:218 (-) Transcript_11410:276-929(-)
MFAFCASFYRSLCWVPLFLETIIWFCTTDHHSSLDRAFLCQGSSPERTEAVLLFIPLPPRHILIGALPPSNSTFPRLSRGFRHFAPGVPSVPQPLLPHKLGNEHLTLRPREGLGRFIRFEVNCGRGLVRPFECEGRATSDGRVVPQSSGVLPNFHGGKSHDRGLVCLADGRGVATIIFERVNSGLGVVDPFCVIFLRVLNAATTSVSVVRPNLVEVT